MPRAEREKPRLRLRRTTAATTDAEAEEDVRAARDARDVKDVTTQKEESSNVNT